MRKKNYYIIKFRNKIFKKDQNKNQIGHFKKKVRDIVVVFYKREVSMHAFFYKF